MRPQPSLRARALKFLATREHSRAELGRKLARHTQEAAELETLLDELGRAGHLSDARFVDSLVRRRATRFGSRRIEQELSGHQLAPALSDVALEQLRVGERDRALAVWTKRFGVAPADVSERARQYRFMAGRGFDGETIAWVLKQASRQDTAD